MESIMDSQSFNYTMEDIHFGDKNEKMEKAKQSFLQLKQKICRTHDVIQQYSNKVKECERLKADVESAKKDAEEWKTQHFASLAKVLKLNTVQIEFEKTKKSLTREIAELEIKRAGDQKHLQQLMCKLEDIEDRHSEKLMTIELKKSGLEAKVVDLEQEIKILHKTYDIKKCDTTGKIIDKPKRGRKVKSPAKTTRSAGLLPEISDEINSLNQVIKDDKSDINKIEKQIDKVDASTNTLNTTASQNLFEHVRIKKPITCDKNIMTDEFYSTKTNVYPLLCDKCEAQLDSMPIDKIFKVMTAHPPLISAVPPSPVHLKENNENDRINNLLQIANTSIQNDNNVSIALDKIQQTLQILEKQMKKNEKRKNNQNNFPHCSHSTPINCCGHNNNSINVTNFSQVSMMTALWSSMMKLIDNKSPKSQIQKKKFNLKLNRHRTSKQKVKIKKLKRNINSWIVESDTYDTDCDKAIDVVSQFTPLEKSTTKKIIERQLEENIEIMSQNIENTSEIFSNISPHIDDNLSDNGTTSIISTEKINQTLSVNCPPIINVDPTIRKQMHPVNVTAPTLLQLLNKSQSKNNESDDTSLNITDPIESMDTDISTTGECVPAIKKRIAHVNTANVKINDTISLDNDELLMKEITSSEESDEMVKSKRKKVTRSATKFEELSISIPQESKPKSITPRKNSERVNNKVKIKKITSNIMDNLFGPDDCSVEINTSMKIDDKTDDDNQENNEFIVSNVQSNITNKSNDSMANLNIITHEIKQSLPLAIVNDEKYDETIEVNNEKINNDDIKSPELMEKNIECLSEKIQVDVSNENLDKSPESINNSENNIECEIKKKLINSPMKNVNNSINVYQMSPSIIRTRNTRCRSIESTQININENQPTLRKRRRIDSVTQSDSESPTKFLDEKKNNVSPTSNKSVTIINRNNKKLITEIIPSEIEMISKPKRITRSMKKTEESPIRILAQSSSIMESSSSKRFGSPRVGKKLRTPVKEVDDVSVNLSKKLVKNLFSSDDEEKKLKSNFEHDANHSDNSSINDSERINSNENVSDVLENKSDEIKLNCPPCKINNINQDEKNNEEEEEEEEEANFFDLILKIPNIDENSENTEINSMNDLKKSTDEVNSDEKISETTSTNEFDSPLSPDPISKTLPDCLSPKNINIPFDCTGKKENDNAIQSIQQLINYQTTKIEPDNSKKLQNLPKYSQESVKELRNRTVPVILKDNISTISKNNSNCDSIKEKMTNHRGNIKQLLDQYLIMNKKKDFDIKSKKYHTPAAIKVTDDIMSTVKQEIMQIINSPDWDNSVHHNVVDNLSKINSDLSVIKSIIDLICELSLLNESLDRTYTPPAPMMTPSQRKIIAILVSLDRIKPDFICSFLNAINYNLFHIGGGSLKNEEIQSLARIFVVLCKIKKDRERVRMMICDAMYSLHSKHIFIIHTALTCWAEVLPIYQENSRQYLPMCIVHIIQNHTTKQSDVESKSIQLKNLIKNYYNYPQSNSLSKIILDEFLNELTKPNYDKTVLTAILLLAKTEGTEWTYKNIIKERLLSIIIENKNSSSYDALVLLGYLMKCFPLHDPDGAVKNIVEQLCAILNAGTTSVDIQEGAVMALILLSFRHRHTAILRSILTWQPPRSLPSPLQSQLQIFFDSRTCQQWQDIKIE